MTDPCPCCGAARLTVEGEMVACKNVSGGIEKKLLAPRFDCRCWCLVKCTRCKLCGEHCECAKRGTAKTLERKEQARTLLAFRKQGSLGLDVAPPDKKTKARKR